MECIYKSSVKIQDDGVKAVLLLYFMYFVNIPGLDEDICIKCGGKMHHGYKDRNMRSQAGNEC